MKKIIIGVLAALFVICTAGAVLLLNKGDETRQAEENTSKIQGEHPITYIYTDRDEKEHKKEVTCTVAEPDADTIREITERDADTDTGRLSGTESQGGSETEQKEIQEGMPEEQEEQPAPKTGDSGWKMAVYTILFVVSSGVFTSICYVRRKIRKL